MNIVKHVLVSVCERDIEVRVYDSLEEAQAEMRRQLFEEVLDGRLDDYDEDDYSIDDYSAYANDIHHANNDWLIETVTIYTGDSHGE